MRILKMPNASTAPQALWRQLLRDPGAATATADLIRALNSHVNFDRDVPAGTVLLIPDAADVKANAGIGAGSGQVDGLLADVEAALTAIAARVTSGLKQAEAGQAAIAAALKSAPAKRLVDSDPQVNASLETAAAQAKADQKRAKEIQSQLAAIQKQAPAELERLRKMLAG
jgi:uncharacterized phage infection (PIP) family protein YhgE